MALTPEEMQEAWTLLQVSPQLSKRTYLQKKASLDKYIKEIDTKLENRSWKWWQSWTTWDFNRFPVFCHDCGLEKCVPEFNQVGVKSVMINIHCPVCNMMMWRNEDWYSRHTRDKAG